VRLNRGAGAGLGDAVDLDEPDILAGVEDAATDAEPAEFDTPVPPPAQVVSLYCCHLALDYLARL
jgi:hypothetical protein